MPEARLQRTREATPELVDSISATELLELIQQAFPLQTYVLRNVTNPKTGHTREEREYLPFTVPALESRKL